MLRRIPEDTLCNLLRASTADVLSSLKVKHKQVTVWGVSVSRPTPSLKDQCVRICLVTLLTRCPAWWNLLRGAAPTPPPHLRWHISLQSRQVVPLWYGSHAGMYFLRYDQWRSKSGRKGRSSPGNTQRGATNSEFLPSNKRSNYASSYDHYFFERGH